LLSLEPGEGLGVRFERLRPLSKLPRFVRYSLNVPLARARLRDFEPDVVNAHFLPNYGWMAASLGVRPLVLTTLGSDLLLVPHRTPMHAWRTRWVLRRCDRVTTDAYMLTRAVARFGYLEDNILTVPFGVELETFDRAATVHPRANRSPLKVLSTRRLERLYDVQTLFRAAMRLSSAIRDALQLRIVGAGSEAPALHAAARGTTILPETRFLGWLDPPALVAELCAAHVYVSTSHSDSTSVSLLEAMAAGCFPVVTNIEGNREWIRHGDNGLLFPPGDDAALARCLERAADDPELRRRAATLNRALIVDRATWTRNMERVERLFETLVAANAAPDPSRQQG
jgi:glycosyltransferase involved in cell wall biosynthesis